MRFRLALAAILAATQAANAFPTMKAEDCAATWKIIGNTHDLSDAGVSKDGWCQMPRSVDAKATLEWRAEGLQQFLQQSRVPSALEIRIQGDDLMDIFPQERAPGAPEIPVRVTLTLRDNAEEKQLIIERLQIRGPKENTVLLQGVLHDVDLSSIAMAQVSLGSANLRDVTLMASGNRHLEPYLRPYLGATFPERSRSRSEMIDRVSNWPDHSFPPATKRAVKQLIAQLPSPNGTLKAHIDMGAGLSAGIFIQGFVFGEIQEDMLGSILEHLVFHAEWIPSE